MSSGFEVTPGPWEVTNGTDVFTRLGARNGAGVHAADNDGWYIADCCMGEAGADDTLRYAEQRANAQLIAEAGTVLHETGLTPRQLADLVARLKLEAQGHAQEARTANATIAEIYQVCTGSTGEPGNWNGAEPVRQLAESRAELLEALQNAVAYGLPDEISDAAVTAIANATQQRKEPGA